MKLPIKSIHNIFYNIAKYLSGIYALDIAPQIVKNNSLISAVAYFKKKYKIFRPASVRFLIKLYCYLLETPQNSLSLEKNTSFIIHFCCWGTTYHEKAKTYLLPSLLSNGNLPSISQQHKTTLLIHCSLKIKEELIASPVIKQIKKYAAVEFLLLPNPLMKSYNANFRYPQFFKKLTEINNNIKYFLLGALQAQALEIAMKNKAYISFLMPDFVLSDRFFIKAFSIIKDKKLLGASAFRTDFHKVSNDLELFFADRAKTKLSIPAKVLERLQVNHIHSAAKRIIVSESNLHFSPCAQLLFETTNGFILRTFHYHPILLNCQQYQYQFRMDYSPIDNNLLNQIVAPDLPYDQQIAICDASSGIAFMELSDENINSISPRPNEKTYYHELLQMICEMILKRPNIYDMPLNRYFCSIKNKYESTDIYREGNFISDDRFFSDLKEHLHWTTLK